MRTSVKLWASGLALAALAACGGGGGGGGGAGTPTPGTIAGSLGPVDPVQVASFGVDGSNGGGFGAADAGADGTAGEGGPINNGTVIITDASNPAKTVRVKTDATGYYFAKITGFTAPLLVKVVSQNGKVYNSVRDEAVAAGGVATINITALTDKMTSLVAGTASVSALTPADITSAKVASAKAEVLATFITALTAAGVPNPSAFDPIKTPFKADGTGYDKVLDQVRHETNAAGGTDLYPKTVNYAADGTVSTLPLSPSLTLVLSSGKELNFDRLESLRLRMVACFAQAEAARNFGGTGNACSGLVHPNFKSAGRDFEEVIVQASGRRDGNRILENADVMTGAQFDAPEILLQEKSTATVADFDKSIVRLSWFQPANQSYRQADLTMRRFDGFSNSTAQKSLITNKDASTSDWWFYGGQSNYGYGVSSRLYRYTNLNPATNTSANTISAAISNDESALALYVGTQKFNTTTRAWEDSGVAYAKVTGPGLPIAGIVVSRISSATSTGACIIPTDSAYNASNAPIATEATYMGYYSSTGVLPGTVGTNVVPSTQQSYTSSVFDYSIPGPSLPVGASRTVAASGLSGPVTATYNFDLSVPGLGTLTQNALVPPNTFGTVPFTFPQTAASVGLSSFTVLVTFTAGTQTGTYTSAAFDVFTNPLTLPIGSTRTVGFSQFNFQAAPVTYTIAVTVPGQPTVSQSTLIPAGTSSFVGVAFPQTAASVGVNSFTARISYTSLTQTFTFTYAAFTGSTTNRYSLERSYQDTGASFPYGTTTSAYGSNRNTLPVDYAALKPWSVYKFELYNAAGVLVSTEYDRISTQLRPPQALRTMALHDLSPSHATLLAPLKAAAPTVAVTWINNPGLPAPRLAGGGSFLFEPATFPSGYPRFEHGRSLKRQALSTSGPQLVTFAASDASNFAGCRVPVGNTNAMERLDAARVFSATGSTTSQTGRSVFLNSFINRMRITQTAEWYN
jgi:hypothetical protein